LLGLASVGKGWFVRLFVLSTIAALLPLTLFADATWLLIIQVRARRLLTAPATTCPAGHVVELRPAAWSCPCGMTWSGSGFEPCPACRRTGMVQCACGRTLLNPLSKDLGQ